MPESAACVCGHDPRHHDKRKSVYAGLMADYKVVWACGWKGCGCPSYVKQTACSCGHPWREHVAGRCDGPVERTPVFPDGNCPCVLSLERSSTADPAAGAPSATSQP